MKRISPLTALLPLSLQLPQNRIVRAYRNLRNDIRRSSSQNPVTVNVQTPQLKSSSKPMPDEFRVGYRRALGEQQFRRQRVRQPFGTTLLLICLYLAFSVWPFQVLPVFSFFTIFWAAFVLYLFFSKNYMFAVIFIIAFPLFNYAFAQDLFAEGQLVSDNLKEKISIGNPIDAFKGLIYKNYGTWGNPDIVEQEPQKGIQILTFATNTVFKEDKAVRIDAKVQIDGLYDPLTEQYEAQNVFFSCYEEDRAGKRVQDGEIYVDDYPAKKSLDGNDLKKATSTHYVACLFPKGIRIQTTGAPISGTIWGVEEGTEVGNKIITKKRVVFEARSRMLQIAGLKLWTVQKVNAPEDITKIVNDPTLDADGRSKAQCKRGCGGPYLLSLSTGVMPITEEKSPLLNVYFVKNQNRFGTLAELHSLQIIFPQALDAELGLEGLQTPCDFSPDKALRDDKLKSVNQQLVDALNITATDQQPSLPLEFQCGYKINNPLEKLGFHELTARADFDVVIRKRGLVDVYREKPTTSGGNNLA